MGLFRNVIFTFDTKKRSIGAHGSPNSAAEMLAFMEGLDPSTLYSQEDDTSQEDISGSDLKRKRWSPEQNEDDSKSPEPDFDAGNGAKK
jgi:hypothetical protein